MIKDKTRYIFVGNRFFVLGEMLRLGLNLVRVYALKGSYLEKELKEKEIDYELIPAKKEFVIQLKTLEFDYLISNGLPVILPISSLIVNNGKQFINIHPSLLPDLRGMDPVPGALYYAKDSGATCHLMDDDIDTGKIIAKVPIKYDTSLDVKLLYQLSFKAEVEVFRMAYDRGFRPLGDQQLDESDIYYSFSEKDLYFNFVNSDEQILRTVRAFNNENKLARFDIGGRGYKVRAAKTFARGHFEALFSEIESQHVAMKFGTSLLIKRPESYMLLEGLDGNLEAIEVNDCVL